MTVVLAGTGLVVGWLLPWLIARIPDRAMADGEPAPTLYRTLAARRGLPVGLAVFTASAWALISVSQVELGPARAAYLLVAALGTAMAYVDVREHRLPDWLTGPAFAGAALSLAVAATITGEWGSYGRAWAGATVTVALYLILALIPPAGLGLGDVKLAAVLGLLLGWISWPTVVVGVFAGFLIGALTGVVLSVVLLLTGRSARHASIPFGPAMLLGALIAVVWSESIVDTYVSF